jgi:lysophospholipase L1-like esterase
MKQIICIHQTGVLLAVRNLSGGQMRAALIFLGFVALAAFALLTNSKIDRLIRTDARALDLMERQSPALNHEHSVVREFVLKSQLAGVRMPVVILGDSITEAAALPSALCGYPIINAGIGGFAVEEINAAVPQLLHSGQARLVVVAAGTNNATRGSSAADFASSYAALLETIKPLTEQVMLVTVPPIYSGTLADQAFDPKLLPALNATIMANAADKLYGYVDLSRPFGDGPANPTIDGVHLTADGYKEWTGAVLSGIKKALSCG